MSMKKMQIGCDFLHIVSIFTHFFLICAHVYAKKVVILHPICKIANFNVIMI